MPLQAFEPPLVSRLGLVFGATASVLTLLYVADVDIVDDGFWLKPSDTVQKVFLHSTCPPSQGTEHLPCAASAGHNHAFLGGI